MFDPFLENDLDGIAVPPTEEQWAMRFEQLSRQKDSAIDNALRDTESSTEYYLEYTKGYDFYFTLLEEMERCFSCGCWIASISVGSAALDAFFHEVWGVTRGDQIEAKLNEINFPHISMWQLIRRNRNSIIHVKEESNYNEQNNYDLHYIAKQTAWLSYYFCYYFHFNKS